MTALRRHANFPVILSRASALLTLAALVLLSGCSSLQRQLLRFYKRESRPGQTRLTEPVTTIPARIEANYFIVEVKWDKHGPWRFIVDTGSSVTLLSPEYVKRYPAEKKDGDSARSIKPINVRSASGGTQKLPPANVRIIRLGAAQFLNVPVLVYDCTELSAHFGMRIDGIIGFPLFRDTVFELDYPQSRLVISRRAAARSPESGSTVRFNNEIRAPIIPVRLDNETFTVLIDSGSDGALILNPLGLKPGFAQQPRPGATIGSLLGDRAQEIGRLATPLHIGDCTVENPVVDITDQLSALGGEILKNYRLVFDPKLGTVTFERAENTPLVMGAHRSAGISFTKTPAYWRVASVVPGSPAEAAGVQAGDIVARIDGESVSEFNLRRYDALVRTADEITFTFVQGTREKPVVISVFDLVK